MKKIYIYLGSVFVEECENYKEDKKFKYYYYIVLEMKDSIGNYSVRQFPTNVKANNWDELLDLAKDEWGDGYFPVKNLKHTKHIWK